MGCSVSVATRNMALPSGSPHPFEEDRSWKTTTTADGVLVMARKAGAAESGKVKAKILHMERVTGIKTGASEGFWSRSLETPQKQGTL